LAEAMLRGANLSQTLVVSRMTFSMKVPPCRLTKPSPAASHSGDSPLS
jgi:hypothetical protein